MKNFVSGFAAIVGAPNAGKSTLLNRVLGVRVAAESPKPQTTRGKILGVLTASDAQIIFTDTPGWHTPKSKLGEYMVKSVGSAVFDADCIVLAVPVKTTLDASLLENVQKTNKPVVLVMTKTDLISKSDILPEIEKYNSMVKSGTFSDVVPISAVKGENIDEFICCVKKYLPQGPKYFPDDAVTDMTEREVIAEIIREKALLVLSEEVPHGLYVAIDSFKERADKPITDVEATIFCEKLSHKGIVIGKGGTAIKKIGSFARTDVERFLNKKVFLSLTVKVKEGWLDNSKLLSNFGYDVKNI
ncbi:MAG: GTPase Era [Clostridiales bacterium]|nr:GTPase Era [Clostridiales bacterium]